MNRRRVLLALCASWFASGLEAAEPVRHRLLLQVSEDHLDRLMTSLQIARQVKEHYGPDQVEVVLVVFGAGVQNLKYYAPVALKNRLARVRDLGVRVLVCERSLRNAGLTPSKMLPDIEFTPNGVVTLLEQIEQGWVNVRP